MPASPRKVALAAALVAALVLVKMLVFDKRLTANVQHAAHAAPPPRKGPQCCQPVVMGTGALGAFVDAGAFVVVDRNRSGAPQLQRCCGGAVRLNDVAPAPEPLLRAVTRADVDFVARRGPCPARAARLNITACLIVRNRVKLTVEWLQWMRLIGVRQFHVYDDNSDDGLAAALAPFVDAGAVALHAVPLPPYDFRGVPQSGGPLFGAYADCTRRAALTGDWVALLDSDEFPALTNHTCLTDFVADAVAAAAARPGVPVAGAVALPWVYAGHRGELRDTARTQLERTAFFEGAADPAQHIKVIARAVLATGMGNPHLMNLANGTVTVFVTGEVVPGVGFASQPPAAAVALGRLLHYHRRSFASFLLRHADGKVDIRMAAATQQLDVPAAFETWRADAIPPEAAAWPAGGRVRRTHELLLTAMGLDAWRPESTTAALPAAPDGTRAESEPIGGFCWVRCCRYP
jgi:hypothetical protein